jgi:hypothetical protein
MNLFKTEDLFLSLLVASSLLCFQAAITVPSAFVCRGVLFDVGFHVHDRMFPKNILM